MKFTIDKEEFSKTLTNVCRIVQKGSNPILYNIKLTLNELGLNIIGSNGDLSISQTIPLFIGQKEIIRDVHQGSILIDARLISEIVKKFAGKEVVFEIIDGCVAKVTDNKTSYELATSNAEEYVDIDFSCQGTNLKFESKTLLNAVNQVAFAASTKDNRTIIQAINFNASDKKLVLIALDGARLATKTLSIDSDESFNVNIPAKNLVESLKSVTNEEFIEFYISYNKLLIVLNNQLISLTMLSGLYPDTKRVIPHELFYELTVNSNEILNAIDRISVLNMEKENVVKLVMNANAIELSSRSQSYSSSAVETLNEFRYKGNQLEICFNGENVVEAVKALKSQNVTFKFVGEMKPFVVIDENDNSVLQLITPMHSI